MCNLETEGTKYGCGHYVITKKVAKHDCGSPYCTHSAAHNPHCRNCTHDHFLGPDKSEKITFSTSEFCNICDEYWKPKQKLQQAQQKQKQRR
ncbi:hypothetical protein K474DRAFT_1703958 [Panus rudis PR-1116 ss-1]|nr:hypothetical protein K474DRAFT_1703958 [Panus rudis PR-1116 ss-1]